MPMIYDRKTHHNFGFPNLWAMLYYGTPNPSFDIPN